MDARVAFELNSPHAMPMKPYNEDSKLTSLQKLSVIESLQQDMSIKSMLTNFATIAATFVPISSLSFNSSAQNYKIDLNKQHHFFQSFAIFDNTSLLGKLTYTSKQKLSLLESSILRELNKLLSRPLNLAISIYNLELRVKQDHLTGLGNRAMFDESVQRAIEQNSRNNSGLVLLLMDLNKFKQVNDTYGHKAGDLVLISFAKILNKVIRTSDQAFRFGGDEFALLLQPAESEAAMAVKARLSSEIATDPIMNKYNVGSAVGFANWQQGQSLESLFELADGELYKNKNA